MEGVMLARAAVAVAITAVLLVVPGGAFGGPSHRAPSAGAVPALLTDATPVPVGRPTAPLAPSNEIRLTISLASADPHGLATFLSAVDAPGSPLYRHFLTAGEFERRFGPRPAAAGVVERTLSAAGGSFVGPTPGGMGVQAVVPVRSVETLFGVQLVTFSTAAGTVAYTAVGRPGLPSAWVGLVSGVGGLSDARNDALVATLANSRDARPVAPGGALFVNDTATHAQWLFGSDIAQAYRVADLWNSTRVRDGRYPSGIAIATLLAGGFNTSTAQNLPPWDPRVVSAYFNDTFGPSWPLPSLTGVPVTPPGAPTPPAPGSFGAQSDSTPNEFENSLDLEMAGSLAPGAALYNFYFAGSLLIGAGHVAGQIADYLADDLGAALNFSYGAEHLAVVSGSFGVPDLNDSLWNSYLAQAAAMGVTVVCASGDQGNAPDGLTGGSDGPGVLWPASVANGTTGSVSVGGTNVSLRGVATSTTSGSSLTTAFDPKVTGISAQAAWYDLDAPSGVAGSEGGLSAVYPEPYWQFHSAAQPAIVAAAEIQRATSLGRAEPDVALPANNTVAFVFANATGVVFYEVLGGTSVAAPVLAGLLASVVEVESARAGTYGLGFLDPELYRIGSFFAAANGTPEEAQDPFLDVVTGGNNLFAAGPGWDAVTGWGGISAPLFLAADVNATIADYVYTGPTPGLPHPASSGPSELEYLLIGGGVAVAAAVVVLLARPARRSGGPPTSAVGATVAGSPYGPVAGVAPAAGASFPCPYCGKDRPAEPVRCPSCGAL